MVKETQVMVLLSTGSPNILPKHKDVYTKGEFDYHCLVIVVAEKPNIVGDIVLPLYVPSQEYDSCYPFV